MIFAKEFVAQGWIVDIILVAAPGKSPVQAFCRYVLAPEDKLPQFAGKQGQHTRCEHCLEVSQNRQNFLLERIGNCRCGSNSHCTERKICVLWTQRDAYIPAGPREPIPELEIPQQICRNLVVENIGKKKKTTISTGSSGGVVCAKTASGYPKPAHVAKRIASLPR